MMDHTVATRVGVILLFLVTPYAARGDITSFDNESSWQAAISDRTLANFDGFTGSVTTQYPGATFSSFNSGTPSSLASSFALSPLRGKRPAGAFLFSRNL